MAARSVRRLLPLLLAACCLISQVSGWSSVSSPAAELRTPAEGVHSGDALRHQLLFDTEARTAGVAVEDGRRTSGAATGGEAPSAATPARAAELEDGGVASRPWQMTRGGALLRAGLRPAVLRRSKLARRFLAAPADVEDAGTDGASASCHSNSNSVHINCGPPAATSKP